jgi:hypothetical protein
MTGTRDTRDLQFTVQQPHLLHINLCQNIMFDQGRVIPYIGDVPVTFVGPLGPLVSSNKTTPRTLSSHHTKFVDKLQVQGSRSGAAIDPRVIHGSLDRYVTRIVLR